MSNKIKIIQKSKFAFIERDRNLNWNFKYTHFFLLRNKKRPLFYTIASNRWKCRWKKRANFLWPTWRDLQDADVKCLRNFSKLPKSDIRVFDRNATDVRDIEKKVNKLFFMNKNHKYLLEWQEKNSVKKAISKKCDEC